MPSNECRSRRMIAQSDRHRSPGPGDLNTTDVWVRLNTALPGATLRAGDTGIYPDVGADWVTLERNVLYGNTDAVSGVEPKRIRIAERARLFYEDTLGGPPRWTST
jgi:hypothetical protein